VRSVVESLVRQHSHFSLDADESVGDVVTGTQAVNEPCSRI